MVRAPNFPRSFPASSAQVAGLPPAGGTLGWRTYEYAQPSQPLSISLHPGMCWKSHIAGLFRYDGMMSKTSRMANGTKAPDAKLQALT